MGLSTVMSVMGWIFVLRIDINLTRASDHFPICICVLSWGSQFFFVFLCIWPAIFIFPENVLITVGFCCGRSLKDEFAAGVFIDSQLRC